MKRVRKRKRPTSVVELCAEARAVAERLRSLLIQRDMAAGVDDAAIELAADALVRFVKARRVVDREGLFVEVATRRGGTARFPHPALRIAQAERDAAMRYLKQLGMTPAARGDTRKLGSEQAVGLDEILGFA